MVRCGALYEMARWAYGQRTKYFIGLTRIHYNFLFKHKVLIYLITMNTTNKPETNNTTDCTKEETPMDNLTTAYGCKTGTLIDMYDNHKQVFAFDVHVSLDDGYRAALGYARRLRGDKSHVKDEGVIPGGDGTDQVVMKTRAVDKGKTILQMCRELKELNFMFTWDDMCN